MENRLKEARQRQGLPMEILAYRARCSVRHVWLWEKWGIPPKRPIAERIAQALGVSLEELGYYDSAQAQEA